MGKYILTADVDTDLSNIYVYTMENYDYRQWIKYRSALDKTFQFIADFPSTGNQGYMSKRQIKSRLYKFTSGKHHIFYRKNSLTKNVHIVGLVHVSRDIKRALSPQQLQTRTTPKKQQNKGNNKSRGR